MSIEIRPVTTQRQLKTFIDFPHDLYRGVPNYVPQLFRQQKALLHPKHSPFAEHSAIQPFLAVDGDRVTGRIAAIENTVYNRFHDDRTGFFGFFDSRDDRETTAALVESCSSWLTERGLDSMRGPVNPDMNNSCGVLTSGFCELPSVFMPFNAPYYSGLLSNAGLDVCKQLNAWDIQSNRIPETVFRYGQRIKSRLQKAGYRLRPVRGREFDADMKMLREVYNKSLAATWGASPITAKEFQEQAAGLKMICRKEYIQIAEFGGKIVGFIGAVPNIHEIQKGIRRGRLQPIGWAKILFRWRSIKGSRIVMYGVDPEHRSRGLASWLYITVIRTLRARGFTSAEASFVLADNVPVNDLSKRLGGLCRKTYAIFEKPLGVGCEAGEGS